ncbi:MAG: hypothetical protein V1811_00465 [Candidatus Micrarchaeota archaeon]
MAIGDRTRKMGLSPFLRHEYPLPKGKRYYPPTFDEYPWGEKRIPVGAVFSTRRKIERFIGNPAKNILLKPASSVRVRITTLELPGNFDAEVSLRSLLARYGLHAVQQGQNELILTNLGPHDFPLEKGMELGRNLPHQKKLSPLTKKEIVRLIRRKQLRLPLGSKVRNDGQVEVYILHMQADLLRQEWGAKRVDSDLLRRLFSNPVGRKQFSIGTALRLGDQPVIKPGEFLLTAASPLKLPPNVFALISDKIVCSAEGKKTVGPAQFSSSRGIDVGYDGPVYVEAFLPPKEKQPVQLHKILLTLHKAMPGMAKPRPEKVVKKRQLRLFNEARRQNLFRFEELG